jgi:hypothetical protein
MEALVGVIPEIHEVTAVGEVIAGDRLASLNQSDKQQLRESVKKAIEMINKRLDNNRSVLLSSVLDSPTITEALTTVIFLITVVSSTCPSARPNTSTT